MRNRGGSIMMTLLGIMGGLRPVVRVFDREASRWALGAARGDSAPASVKPAVATDGTPVLLLFCGGYSAGCAG